MKLSALIEYAQEKLISNGDVDVQILYESKEDGVQYQGPLTDIASDGLGNVILMHEEFIPDWEELQEGEKRKV